MSLMTGSRRHLLIGVGSVAAALAGCTGDDSDDDADPEAAAEAITLASLELAKVGEMLAREDDLDIEDPRDIHELLDDVEATLEAAEEDATDEQTEQIAFLRDVADWLRLATAAVEAFDNWDEEFERSRMYFGEDRYDDAAEAAESARDELEDAETKLAGASEAYEGLDDQRLDDLEELDHRSIVSWTEGEFSDGLSAAKGLTNGFAELIPGFEQFFTALEPLQVDEDEEDIDEEAWQEAESRFGAAREQFLVAEATFRDAEEDSPPALLEDLIALTSLSGDLAEASGHYQNAMEAAREKDWERFDEEVAAAEAVLS